MNSQKIAMTTRVKEMPPMRSIYISKKSFQSDGPFNLGLETTAFLPPPDEVIGLRLHRAIDKMATFLKLLGGRG